MGFWNIVKELSEVKNLCIFTSLRMPAMQVSSIFAIRLQSYRLVEFMCTCIMGGINGAIGILRKAKVVTDRDIVSLRDRGDLSSPRVFTFK